jgi:hypothetical protein
LNPEDFETLRDDLELERVKDFERIESSYIS